MTAAMPVGTREAGGRMIAQGGQPVDVAETIAWSRAGGYGNVVRVCGRPHSGA